MNRKLLHIFLDLDLTLVDIFPLWRKLWVNQLAQRLHEDTDVVHATGARIWEQGGLYTLEGHLRALKVDPEQTPWTIELREQFLARVRAGGANYEDTLPFLDALAHHRLMRSIITFGHPAYQQVKIDGLSRPDGFFEEVHFTKSPGEKGWILNRAMRTDHVVFVDDNPVEHTQVARICPKVHRIQLCRQADFHRASEADHIVSNLPQALEVILSLTNRQPEESR